MSYSKGDGCCEGEGGLILQKRQINFDEKLLTDLGGIRKVNHIAVVAAQEKENQLLCVLQMRLSMPVADLSFLSRFSLYGIYDS